MDLKSTLRQIPGFPKPGITFIDITTLINKPDAFEWTVNELYKPYEGQKIDKVVCIESRGFIFGAPLALRLGAGMVIVRKPNKLPADTYSYTYELEYGQDSVEIHKDAIGEGERVVVVDDLLATGGTVDATMKLLKNFDCQVEGISFVVELTFLKGRDKLKPIPVHSLVTFDSE
ncbi:MAG: adenine phosphoribosyltransferase [Candidatus Omnitrophica bacterium]|nr:adenine phosphoribosyltransferase [Candidatus Omnitrophota bacterium]